MTAFNLKVVIVIVISFQTFTRIQAAEYQSPIFKDDINKDWSFKTLANIVRDGINNNLEIPWGLIESAAGDDALPTDALVDVVLNDQLPLLLPAVIGFLAALLVPIFALLFCCCRCCCGNCGGKLTASDINKQGTAGLICNGFVVLAAAGIILAMAYGVPVSGTRVKQTPGVVVDSLKCGANDLPIFVSTLVQDAKYVVALHLNDTVESIKVMFKDLPNLLTEPLMNSTKGYITTIEHDVNSIITAVDSLHTVENSTNSTVDSVITHLDALEKAMNDLNANLTFMKDKCITDGEVFCDTLPSGSADPVDFDSTALTDLTAMITDLVGETQDVNLTQYLTMGNDTFAAIPETIKNATVQTVDDVMASLDQVTDKVLPEVNSALDEVNNMVENLGLNDTVVSMEKSVDEIDEVVDPIFNLAMKILGGYLGLIGGCALLGMFLGLACRGKASSPNQGRAGATACGARCLMCSVVLAVVIIFIILLLGSLFMIIGGNLTIVCKTVQEVTFVDKLVEIGALSDGENLGSVLMGNENVTISAQAFMEGCRADGTLFSSFNVSQMMNITDMLNATEYVPDIGQDTKDSINATIQGINVFDADFLNDISSQLAFPDNSSSDDMQTIKDEINDFDLLAVSQNMTNVADSVAAHPWYANYYRSIASTLERVHYQTKIPLEQSIENLELVFEDLNATGNSIKSAVEDLNTTLNSMQEFIQSQAVEVIIQSIDEFRDSMLVLPEKLLDNIVKTLSKDVGQCKIVGDMYDSITGSVCVYFLDSFNVLWAGLYVSGLTFIFLMIANCRLGQYFRRADPIPSEARNTNYNAGPRRRDIVINMSPVPPYIISENANNNASTKLGSSSRMQQLRDYVARKRGQFSTGSKSPQLLRMRQLHEDLKEAREKRDRSSHRDRTDIYQRIQPKIEPRFIEESDELQELHNEGHEDFNCGTTREVFNDVMVDQCGDGNEDTVVPETQHDDPVFYNIKKVADHKFRLVPIAFSSSQTSSDQLRMRANLEEIDGLEENGLLKETDKAIGNETSEESGSIADAVYNKTHFGAEPGLDDSFYMTDASNETSLLIEMKDGADDYHSCGNINYGVHTPQNPKYETGYASDPVQLVSDMNKITCSLCKDSHKASLLLSELQQEIPEFGDRKLEFHPSPNHRLDKSLPKTIDSYADNINPFQAKNNHQSCNGKPGEYSEEVGCSSSDYQSLCHMHKTRSYPRNSGTFLDVQVSPYTTLKDQSRNSNIGGDTPVKGSDGPVEESNCAAVATSTEGIKPESVDHNDYLQSSLPYDLAINNYMATKYPRESRDFEDGSLYQQSLLENASDTGGCNTVADCGDESSIGAPQHLSVLASKALITEALSRFIPDDPVLPYGTASTKKSSSKLTYM